MALEFKSEGFGCGQGRVRRSVKSQDVSERVQRDAMLHVTGVANKSKGVKLKKTLDVIEVEVGCPRKVGNQHFQRDMIEEEPTNAMNK